MSFGLVLYFIFESAFELEIELKLKVEGTDFLVWQPCSEMVDRIKKGLRRLSP